jgi:RHS repeat-associated protein
VGEGQGEGQITASTAPAITNQYGIYPDSPFGTGMLFVKTKNSADAYYNTVYHHDHLSTPIQATDRSGNIVWSAKYSAFGKTTLTTPTATADKPVIESNLRFPGQVEDAETGLYYNWHRYYDPDIGRYVTADPIGLLGGVNLYRYVGGNPVNSIDPLGLDTISLSTNVQLPAFLVEKINGVEGMSGFHSGVAIEFPGANGGNWNFGGYFGADFMANIGLGKSTLNLGYDKGSICDLAKGSGEIAALIGIGEGGLSFDPETGDLQGGHIGVGIAPGNFFKFLKKIAKGNKFAEAYLNNMVSVGGSQNARTSSLNQCGCE